MQWRSKTEQNVVKSVKIRLALKWEYFPGTTHLIKDMSMINVKYNIYINIHIKY